MQILYEYWYEVDTPYSGDFDLCTGWLFKYYIELTLGEDIESSYLTWKPEQHILTPKYYIMCSLVPLVKHYNVTIKEDDNQLKIRYQRFNGFVTCSDST